MQEIWIILRMISNIFPPLILLCIMTQFRIDQKKSYGIIGLIGVVMCICNCIIYFLYGRAFMMKYFAISVGIPVILSLLILTKDSLSQLIFHFFTVINVLYFTSIIGHLINGMRDDMIWIDVLTRLLLYGFIIYLFYKYLSDAYRFLCVHMKKGWNIIAIIPFLFFFLVMFLGLYPTVRTDNFIAVLILYFILSLVYYVIYEVFRNTYDLIHMEKEEEVLKAQLRMQKQQLELQEHTMEEVRILRHDMRFTLQHLNGLLQVQKYKEALQLLSMYSQKLEETTMPSYCEHSMINTLIKGYDQQCKSAKINVTWKLDVPKDLSFHSLEITLVLANVLENAIHACMQVPQVDRQIEFVFLCKENLMLCCHNSFDGEIELSGEGYPISYEEGHGIGTNSILAFVHKYHGLIDYDIKDHMFQIQIIVDRFTIA